MSCSQRWSLVIDPQLQVGGDSNSVGAPSTPDNDNIKQVCTQGIVWIKNKESENKLEARA